MGAAGSGSAQTLERLTTLAGFQGKYTPVYKGGIAAGNALRDGQVAGFQWLVSAPNAAILEVSTIKTIRLIDFDAPAKKYGFYEKYPFYLPGALPGGRLQRCGSACQYAPHADAADRAQGHQRDDHPHDFEARVLKRGA